MLIILEAVDPTAKHTLQLKMGIKRKLLAGLPIGVIGRHIFSDKATGVAHVNESISVGDFFASFINDTSTAGHLQVRTLHWGFMCGGRFKAKG